MKDDFRKLAFIHKSRLEKGQKTINSQSNYIEAMKQNNVEANQKLDDIDRLILEAECLLGQVNGNSNNIFPHIDFVDDENLIDSHVEEKYSTKKIELELLDLIDYNERDDLETFFAKHQEYAEKHNIDFERNLTTLLTHQDIRQLNQFVDDELRYKNAKCDKYDYMIAGTAGVLGGLIDVFFVGAPTEGILTKVADNAVDGMVIKVASLFENEKFAQFIGVSTKKACTAGNPLTNAISYLERNFKVNYDQCTGNAAGDIFDMSPSNHHIKNIAHWPDLIGLLFSIIAQFTNTSSFIANGRLITMDTDTFHLQGSNLLAKIFCGFCNWLGHIMSDIAGAGGTREKGGRGSGLPIPFYGLFQMLDFGKFGADKKTFAEVCVKVFEKGYDFRHGVALAIPVITTELIIRIMYTVKQYFYHKKDLKDCLPNANIPEVRRMLVVGQGTLCLIDAGDATLRSGGNMVTFLLRTNLIAWVRFSFLAYKECVAFMKNGYIDEEKFDDWLEGEYKNMLRS